MIDADALLAALDRALLRARGGDPCELSARAERLGATRFANSRVTQTSDVLDVTVQLRVAVGQRVGAARVNSLDPEALAGAMIRARAMALGQPEDPSFLGFAAGGAEVAVVPDIDPEIVAGDPAARAARVGVAFAETARAGLAAAGLIQTAEVALAVATSEGARRASVGTLSRLDVIAADDSTSAREGAMATRLRALDPRAISEGAVRLAERWRDPVELPVVPDGTPYDVVLGPAAVAEALEWLSLIGFGARSLEDGSSFLAGRLGERISGPVTIYDDAVSGEDGCPKVPFDAEGTPKARLTLMERGIARACAHDRGTAATAHTASTGHAPPLGDELFDGGAVPQHLHLAAGDQTWESLVGRVERGLWVPRFHYVNGLLDTRRALMTGMTRDGLCLIEGGKLGRGVRNLRWTESILEALERIDGLTKERQLVGGSLGDSVYVCPSVLIRGFRFTGQSR
jgi:predicted Zn-dependent protease